MAALFTEGGHCRVFWQYAVWENDIGYCRFGLLGGGAAAL
jgi:hypothetical protein